MRSKSIRYKRRKTKLILEMKCLNICVFMLTLVIVSISSIVIPKKRVSELEKRELANFPSLSSQNFFSGEYFKDIEDYYNDTFPFREKLINLALIIDDAKGIREGEEEIKLYTVEK